MVLTQKKAINLAQIITFKTPFNMAQIITPQHIYVFLMGPSLGTQKAV